MSTADPLREFAAMATRAHSIGEHRAEVFRRLHEIIGFDFGVMWRPGERDATVEGFDRKYWNTFVARQAVYGDDLGRLACAAAAQNGVVRDAVALTARQRECSAFYEDIIRPIGSAGFLTAALSVRGHIVALLQLGRGGRPGHDFREADADRLRHLAPVIALGETAHALCVPPPDPAEPLSPREAEILKYIQLGYTNREIALAAGTSPHTVRNQIVSLFKKAGVSRRAELVSWALGRL